MIKGSLHLMIDCLAKTDDSLDKVWHNWPLNTFQKGDLLKLEWSYENILCNVIVEEYFLLLQSCNSTLASEAWKVSLISETANGVLAPNPEYKEYVLESQDLVSRQFEWLKISLIARADK